MLPLSPTCYSTFQLLAIFTSQLYYITLYWPIVVTAVYIFLMLQQKTTAVVDHHSINIQMDTHRVNLLYSISSLSVSMTDITLSPKLQLQNISHYYTINCTPWKWRAPMAVQCIQIYLYMDYIELCHRECMKRKVCYLTCKFSHSLLLFVPPAIN